MPKPRRLTLAPRKSPRQQRSSQTVESILEAAAHVLDRGGLAAFNTNRVAERAGVSIGSLYQYFPHKDALMAALIERAQLRTAAAVCGVIEQLQQRPLIEVLERLIDLALAQQFDRPHLAAALDYEERRLPVEPLVQPAAGLMRAALAGLLRRHRPRLPIDDAEAAAEDIFVIARALVDHAALAGIEPQRLRARLRRAVLGYLGLPAKAT